MASYPPILLNISLKSVEGISLDFLYLNIVGYLFYTTSICMLFFDQPVRELYAAKYTPPTLEGEEPHPKHYPLIQINDVAYTVHGLLCTLAVFYQVNFTSFKKNKNQRLSKYTQLLLIGVGSLALFVVTGAIYYPTSGFTLLDVAEILAYIKVTMSTAKHIPQLLYNHQRRSTKGWAIHGTMLDFAGAIFSISQLLLDAYRSNDMGNVLGNTSKLSLAMVCFLFFHFFLN